jgi:biopolymer transport protein ExbD
MVVAAVLAATSRARAEGKARPACALSLEIVPRGLWLGTGPNQRCFAARESGELDSYWLETELAQAKLAACALSLEIAGTRGVVYQDLIHAMDIAQKVGIPDPGLSQPGELAVSFAGADPGTAKRRCKPPVTKAAAQPVRNEPARREHLAGALVVIVTSQELTVAGRRVASVADVLAGSGVVKPLAAALPANPDHLPAVLQADAVTDMAVINRIVQTAQHAGYNDVLFVVKSR